MNGQWIGTYSGTSATPEGKPTSGVAIINIDDRGDHYSGMAYMNETGPDFLSSAASFKIGKGEKKFTIRTEVLPIHPEYRTVTTWKEIIKIAGHEVPFSRYVDVEGNIIENKLCLKWKTELGAVGSSELLKKTGNLPSDCIAKSFDWSSYKSYVEGLEGRRYIFRGQDSQRRLRTKFHRTGRAELNRFVTDDIRALHRNLSARTQHIFNLDNPNENGAFYNLVQHHGYPTPLLDWTYSPYVAVFFAYRSITKEKSKCALETDKVRIFIFDQMQWKNDFRQSNLMNTSFLHFSVTEFIAINNERVIPQQAISTVTNIDDIEGYIAFQEKTKMKTYLNVVDLPVKERAKIMNELCYMGITAGSLFPGLDGACEELRERFFDI
jgi:hypothetical protein